MAKKTTNAKDSDTDKRYDAGGRMYDTTTVLVQKETRNKLNGIKNKLTTNTGEKTTVNDAIEYLIKVHQKETKRIIEL